MAQRVPIPLAVTSGEMGQKFSSDVELTNLRLVQLPPGSPEPFAVEHDPAIVQVASDRVAAVPNASVRCSGNKAICLLSGAAYELEIVNGTLTSRGGSTGSAAKQWSCTRTGTHAVFVAGSSGTILTVPESAGAATSPAMPAGTARAVAYQDGYTIYTRDGTDEFYASNLDDPTTIGALSFSTADALPGSIIGIISDHRELVILKEYSIEFWINSGGTFPFSRSQPGVAERGLAATRCVAKYDNTIYFLGDDLRVYAMRGYQPDPVSPPWVDAALRAFWQTAGAYRRYAAMRFMVTSVAAERYLVIDTDSGGSSLWMNLTTGLWHKHTSSVVGHIDGMLGETQGTPSRSVCLAYLSAGNAFVAELSTTSYIDQGAASQDRTMTLPAIGDGVRRTTMHELALNQVNRTVAGNVTLRWSDDGGASYSSGRAIDGTAARCRWPRVGSFFRRILRVVFASGAPVSVVGASAVVDIGE